MLYDQELKFTFGEELVDSEEIPHQGDLGHDHILSLVVFEVFDSVDLRCGMVLNVTHHFCQGDTLIVVPYSLGIVARHQSLHEWMGFNLSHCYPKILCDQTFLYEVHGVLWDVVKLNLVLWVVLTGCVFEGQSSVESFIQYHP